MMTPDELRALADALEPMAKAPRFEDFDVPAFCAWVRAQADAQPVAWMYEHDGCVDTPLFTVNRWTKCEEPWNESPLFLHPAPVAPQVVASFYTESDELIGTTYAPIKKIRVEDDGTLHVFIDHWPQPVPAGWKLVPVKPTPEMLSAVGMMDGYDWHAPGCSPDADHANWYSAMIAAAPAAPQAEPKRDQSMLDLLAVIHCDGGHHTEAVGIEQSIKDALSAVCVLKGKLAQAEPKREPLTDERIAEIQRAAYERAAQECLATAAELRRCADGCTDGRYDWKADGALDCADAIRALKTNEEQGNE